MLALGGSSASTFEHKKTIIARNSGLLARSVTRTTGVRILKSQK